MRKYEEISDPNLHDVLYYQQQLIDYQKRISTILESFTDAFFEVTTDFTITYWNKEAERLLKIPRKELIGRNLWEVFPAAVSRKFYTEYHRAISEKISLRFEEYNEVMDMWLEVSVFPSGDGLSIYFKDITERKRSTKLLELEKKKYIDLFNFSPLPQWVYNLEDLKFLDVNEAAISHYGYSREEFMKMSIVQIRPKEDKSSLREILKNNVLVGFPHKCSVRHQKKNGEIIEVFVEGNSVSFDGKNARMVMVIDRTQQILANAASAESIARFDIVSKATSDAIWDLNMLTGEMIWNQGIRGIFGYRKTSYDTAWWRSRVHPDDIDLLTQKRDSLIQKKEKRLSLEYRFKRANGTYSFVLDRSFIIFDEHGKAIRMIGSMQDISERIEQLRAIKAQNEKLKEISWIQTHIVRGPLSNILGLVKLIDIENMSKSEIGEIIDHVKIASEQMDNSLREIVNKT
ncbi:MAG: PAS domain S-box protein [Pedobacter sp.]|nr:MAG: PAS domain S-box protein [Pedobacter sp.]